MNKKSTKELVIQNICLLIPLLIYGIYKNGYLVYERGLINVFLVLKPLYLVLLSVIIKIVIDFIKYKQIKIDYNLVIVILIAMMMPYNINFFIYIFEFIILYLLSNLLEKFIKFNKVTFIYLIIILTNFIIKDYTFLNPMESNFNYSFSFLDLFIGRSVGGIATTSVFFSLLAYIILVFSIYYKKDIPLVINFTYLVLAFIYFIITNDDSILLNSEMIFGSVFVATLPMFSPYKSINIIFYSVMIGIITFIISLVFSPIIAIYLSIFIVSLFDNIKLIQKSTKVSKKSLKETK